MPPIIEPDHRGAIVPSATGCTLIRAVGRAIAAGVIVAAMAGCGASPTDVATGRSTSVVTPTPAVTPQAPNPFGTGAGPATAVATPGGAGPSSAPGTIVKTFQLTVNGTVPAADKFVLTFDGGSGPQTVTLCAGDGSGGAPQCMGNGEVITKSFANLTPGATPAPFAFQHVNAQGVADTFYTASTSLSASTTVAAFYNE